MMLSRLRVLVGLSALTLTLAACGQQPAPTTPSTSLLAGQALAPIAPAATRALSGAGVLSDALPGRVSRAGTARGGDAVAA